jgi:flagellar biosynthesis chaperone FliJ
MTLSEAADLETAVREHINEMDQAFFGVLARFQALSEQRQDTQRAQKLATILETAINVIEEKLPPDVRLVNKLLRADYPDGTNAVLEAHRGLLTDAFIKTLDQYVTDLEQHHDELAAHLKQVRAQIAAKRTILRG